ncbi:hypothetical protein XENOCAPTIV_019969 [Xenoophorus captivus]|uniref:Uncharacterized protein n=1 Tax=Xenoophorus captivus TaxID=1517983 RepID=A0ABV0QDU3_9TELE
MCSLVTSIAGLPLRTNEDNESLQASTAATRLLNLCQFLRHKAEADMKAGCSSGNSAYSQNEHETCSTQLAAMNPAFKAAESSAALCFYSQTSVFGLYLSNDDSTSCSFQQEMFVVFPATVGFWFGCKEQSVDLRLATGNWTTAAGLAFIRGQVEKKDLPSGRETLDV